MASNERRLYLGETGAIGVFRSDAIGLRSEPRPFDNPLLVFPRTTLGLKVRRTGERRVIGPGSVLVYAAGDVSVVEWIDDVDRCDFLVPSPSLYETFFGRDWNEAAADRVVMPLAPRLAMVVRRLVGELMAPHAVDELTVQERMAEVSAAVATLADVSVADPPEVHRPADVRLVDRALDHLHDDPATTATLDQVARSLGASAGHLSRVFKRVTGVPVHQYRNSLRVLGAFDELDDDLSAVAQRWGFSSHSHFTSVFATWFGVPPSQARQRFGAQPPMDSGPWWRATNTSVEPLLPTSGNTR
ncbi:MAG: AraC family transcriptional regulator [Actinomycetota bacterium]|nr:MAG: AraC family transcriptional regulator [Acidimicrobiaceae bacterium]